MRQQLLVAAPLVILLFTVCMLCRQGLALPILLGLSLAYDEFSTLRVSLPNAIANDHFALGATVLSGFLGVTISFVGSFRLKPHCALKARCHRPRAGRRGRQAGSGTESTSRPGLRGPAAPGPSLQVR